MKPIMPDNVDTNGGPRLVRQISAEISKLQVTVARIDERMLAQERRIEAAAKPAAIEADKLSEVIKEISSIRADLKGMSTKWAVTVAVIVIFVNLITKLIAGWISQGAP